jgi:hypothetical protein
MLCVAAQGAACRGAVLPGRQCANPVARSAFGASGNLHSTAAGARHGNAARRRAVLSRRSSRGGALHIAAAYDGGRYDGGGDTSTEAEGQVGPAPGYPPAPPLGRGFITRSHFRST